MAKVSWTVQSAFDGRNSHTTKESSPTPCREAAQSNPRMDAMCTAATYCRSSCVARLMFMPLCPPNNQVTDGDPSVTSELPTGVAGPPFGAAPG
jgi:hypothetical protein